MWNERGAVITALQPVRCGKKPPVWVLDYSLCGCCYDEDCTWCQLACRIVSKSLRLQAGKVEFPCAKSQGTPLRGHQWARPFIHLLQPAPRLTLNSICWIMKKVYRTMGRWRTSGSLEEYFTYFTLWAEAEKLPWHFFVVMHIFQHGITTCLSAYIPEQGW